MSLLDGWTEPDELDEAETVPEETGTEEATEPVTESETPTETLPVTEPEETMPETEPVTESTEGMTESTEETLEAAQAEASTQLPVDAADNTEASFTLPVAAVKKILFPSRRKKHIRWNLRIRSPLWRRPLKQSLRRFPKRNRKLSRKQSRKPPGNDSHGSV